LLLDLGGRVGRASIEGELLLEFGWDLLLFDLGGRVGRASMISSSDISLTFFLSFVC